jgi:hypothetical protein
MTKKSGTDGRTDAGTKSIVHIFLKCALIIIRNYHKLVRKFVNSLWENGHGLAPDFVKVLPQIRIYVLKSFFCVKKVIFLIKYPEIWSLKQQPKKNWTIWLSNLIIIKSCFSFRSKFSQFFDSVNQQNTLYRFISRISQKSFGNIALFM